MLKPDFDDSFYGGYKRIFENFSLLEITVNKPIEENRQLKEQLNNLKHARKSSK